MIKLSSINPFVIVNIIANVSAAAIWYLYKGGPLQCLLWLGYAFCSLMVLLMGIL